MLLGAVLSPTFLLEMLLPVLLSLQVCVSMPERSSEWEDYISGKGKKERDKGVDAPLGDAVGKRIDVTQRNGLKLLCEHQVNEGNKRVGKRERESVHHKNTIEHGRNDGQR